MLSILRTALVKKYEKPVGKHTIRAHFGKQAIFGKSNADLESCCLRRWLDASTVQPECCSSAARKSAGVIVPLPLQ